MSGYDDLLHKLNQIPPQADKILRHIRSLDYQVQQIQLNLRPQRQTFLHKLKLNSGSKTARIRQELEQDFQTITKLEGDIELKSRQKITVAEKLYSLIHEPTERLESELQLRGIDKVEEDPRRKRGKKVSKKSLRRGEWQYDPNQPKYCYCSRPSFGEMVMCDNTFCERQWFHLECIEGNTLPDREKWFCRNCRSAQVPPKTNKKGRKK